MAPHSQKSAFTGQSDDHSLIFANEFRARPSRGYQTFKLAYRLPDVITCKLCDKPKNLRAYSDRQKAKMTQERGDCGIICITCSGPNQQEWKCALCDRIMGRNSFANSQRKKGHEAECYDCVAGRIAEPKDDDEDEKHTRKLIEAAIFTTDESKGTAVADKKDDDLSTYSKDDQSHQYKKESRWIAHARDGAGNLDIGGEEWSDNESVLSVVSSESADSHFSI